MSQPERCWPRIKKASSGKLRHLPGILGPPQFPRITPDLTCCHLSAPICPTLPALSTRSQKRPRPPERSQLRTLSHTQQGLGQIQSRAPVVGQDRLSQKIKEWSAPCRKAAATILAFLVPLRVMGLHHIHKSVSGPQWTLVSGRNQSMHDVFLRCKEVAVPATAVGEEDKLLLPGHHPHRPSRLEHLDTERALGHSSALCSCFPLGWPSPLLKTHCTQRDSQVSIITEPVRIQTPRLHWNVASELAF